MAGTHEGYSLGIKANYAQVEEAKKATTALYSALGDVEHRAKNLHMGATLPREINHIDTVTASYIRRLESEGKTYEANKQKVNAYQGAIAELSKKQNELKGALEQSKGATDKGSAAYRTQRIKINENVAEINRYKAGLKSANEQMHQANPNFWDKVKSHLHATNTEAEKTHRTFKEVFAGSFLGNAVSNGLSNIGSGLKNAYEEGMNLNLAVAKINGRFKGMGMSTRQTQSLDKQLNNLKANTTMTGDNVADLQSHMLNWSAIGTKGAMQMAKTISGVGDSSKLTGNQIEHVSASLQRVGANGKVTYSSLSRINKAAPTFMAQLAKGAGMSQSKMIALLKTGKVTQKQFQGWMADASKYSNTAFKGFDKTQAGALKQMQVARQKLEQQFTKPIFNAKTSGLQALKNIMTSKTVMSGANQLGKAISNGIGFLDKHKSDLVGITKNVISFGVAVGKATWKDFAAIIQNIGKSLGIIHGNGKKSGSALHTLKLATDGLAKNKKAVQLVAKAVIAMAAVKGLKAVTNPLVDLGTKGVHTFQVVRGISRGLRGITDAKKIENMGKLETHFFNIGKGARSAAKGIKKATGWLGKKLFSGDKSLLSKATTLGGKIGNSITKAVVASTKFSMGKRLAVGALAGAAVATPEVINAVKDRHSADKRSQDIGGAVGAVAGGALTSMIPVVGPMLAPVGAIIGKYAGRWGGVAVNKFTKGWQAKKPPKKFWSLENLGWSTHDTLNKIGKWGGQVGKKFGASISKGKTFFKKNGKELALTAVMPLLGIPALLYKNNPKFRKAVNSVFSHVKAGWNKGKTFFKKNGKELALTAVMPLLGIPALLYKNNPKFRKAANSVFNHVKAGWKGAKTWASKLGRDTSRNIKNGWNGMRAWASKRLKDVQSGWKGAVSWFGDISSKSNKWFKSKWRGIRSWSSNIYKGFRTGWNGFQKWSGDISSESNKWFKSKWRGIGSWSKGIYKGFQSGWNGLKNWLGDLAKGAVDLFKKPFEGLSSWVNQHIPKPVRDVAGKIGNGAKSLWSKVTGKAHAKGGLMLNNHSALVGEAGPELAYKPYASHVRLLGTNGPQLAKVHSGEHILNAHDTARVIGGGLGHGVILNGYASGTEKLGRAKKTVTEDYKQIVYKSAKPLNKLSKDMNSRWKAFPTDFSKKWNSFWGGLSKGWNKFWGGMDDWAKKRGNNLKAFGNDLDFARGGSGKAFKYTKIKGHARGGLIHTTHGSLVGEAGPELAYKPYASHVRLLGANGPQLAKVHSGEHILNAHDTARVIGGGLGHGMILNGYASGTEKLGETKKTVANNHKQIIYKSSKSFDKLYKSLDKLYKSLNSLYKLNKNVWGKITRQTGKDTSKTRRNVILHYSRMRSGDHKQMEKMHGSVINISKSTAKGFSKTLGKTKSYTLKGYANGTTKLGRAKKTVTDDYKQIADKSSKSLNKLSKKSKNTWSAITQSTGKEANKTRKTAIAHYSGMRTGVYKQMDKMLNSAHKQMGQMRTGVNKQMDKMLNSAHKQMGQMRTGVNKQMEKMHDGVISLSESTAKGFGKALDKTKGFAQGAMKDTIGVINKGISGIDKVLGQFGGNTSVIKPVKFATGTDPSGRLTRDTYAMVNDSTTGPRQEALVSDKNEVYMPRGHDVEMMIPKGWGVLNGTQTLQAGLQHFAKGSGLSHSALRKLAEKAGANPVQSFKDMFLSHLKPNKTDFGRGSTNLASNSGKHFGNPWSAAMWSVINNAIGGGAGKGGTREAFLKYAESTFSGVPYLMGAMSKSVSDCSGMIAQALKHFGLNAGRSTVDMQHSSSLDYLGKNLSNTIPGDLVIFGHGTGAAGHVGIVKNPQTGTMFNETPPHARVTRISDDTGMGYGFYRVKGLHNANASKKTVKSSKRLETLAKNELGSSALKWIKDKLGDEGLLGGNIGGEGVKRWGGTVKRILGMLHLSTSASMVDRVLRQINTESGGNPNARQAGADPDGDGSGPALGLMQTKRTTFNAFKRKGSGGIFNGPADIYAGLNYAKHRYGPSLSALGNGHGYAKGGKPTAHTPFIAGEHGPELITADGPVKVDTHEQTKHKLSDLVNVVRSPKINRPTHTSKQAPIININFNGPIGGSIKDAKRIADIVKREITKYLINIGDEFGTDPSLY